MDEEKNDPNLSNPTTDPAAEAQIVLDLKKTVDSLKAENAAYKKAQAEVYDKILNGGTADPAEPTHRPIADIKKDLAKMSDGEATNLEYCKLAIELDDALIADGKDSCFLPKGRDQNGEAITPTADEEATASKFHRIIEECIQEANGDPARFNMALNYRTR